MSFRYTQPFSKLSNEQRSFYEQNGYILIKNNVDGHLLDKMSARFAKICEDEIGAYSLYVHKDPSLKKRGLKGEFVVNKIQDFVNDPVLWEYCSDPRVLDIVEGIIGPNFTAIHTMLINKPPDADPKFSLHPLHQDLLYFPLRPADSIVAAWTAMERVDERNGCLYVVPGSHLKGILYKHGYPENTKHVLYHGIQGMEHLPRLNVEMEKGDTVFFHPLLLHGSGPNLTKGFRKAISCHYADTNACFIDVRGTPQQDLGDELLAIMRKRGVDATLSDLWQAKSRVARGVPGTFRSNTSHL